MSMVGIFWMLPDLFYADRISINLEQKYGDWLISQEDYNFVWEKLKQNDYLNYLPKRYRDKYWKLPRGRVSYNVLIDKYYVYHGNWFLKKYTTVIEKRFKLNVGNVVYEEDAHYYI